MSTFAPNDFSLGQCDDILPPGQNGNATFAELLAFQLFGIRRPHSSDTRAPYDNLLWGYPGLTDERLGDFYDDASFGVPANHVESRVQPRPDVTITRDRSTGIPHIRSTSCWPAVLLFSSARRHAASTRSGPRVGPVAARA